MLGCRSSPEKSSLTLQPIWLKLTSLMTISIANINSFPVSESTSAPSTSLTVRTCSTRCLGCRPSFPCLCFCHCLCCCLRPCFLPQHLPVVLHLRVLLPLPVSLPLPLHFSSLMWSTSIGSDSFVSFLKSFAIQLLFEFDDRSQLVVTLESSRVHGWCLAQHHANCHIIIQLRRRQFLADVHLVFPRIPRSLERCRNVAHSQRCVFRHKLYPDFEPVSVRYSLYQSQDFAPPSHPTLCRWPTNNDEHI